MNNFAHSPQLNLSLPNLCVVEDEPELCQLLASFLIHQGFACWEAYSAESFFERFEQHQTNIAIVDLNLPGASGLKLVQWLTEQSDMGVIVLTAMQDTAIEKECLLAGADHYLRKPILPDMLSTLITALWHRINIKQAQALTQQQPCPSTSTWQTSKVALTPPEQAILSRLMAKPNQVVSRQDLALAAFQSDRHLNEVTALVHQLHDKLTQLGQPCLIQATANSGYCYVPNPSSSSAATKS